MSIRIQIRRGVSSEWTAKNPVLAEGELALESDTKRYKIGDGVSNWNSIGYGGFQEVSILIPCGDEGVNTTVGNGRGSIVVPYNMVVTEIILGVSDAPTGSSIMADLKYNGVSIFSVKPQIGQGSYSSSGGTIQTSSLNKGGVLSVDVNQVGSTSPGKSLKVWVLGFKAS